jgi:two-component system CheB/CheR fusion protein
MQHVLTSHWTGEQAAALTQVMLQDTRQYAVIFYDLERRITGWNEGACTITGWNAGDMLGQLTATIFVPEDRARKLDELEADMARQLGAGEDERWHLRKDGSRFWASGVSILLKDPGDNPTGFVKIFRDATHLRARMKYLENIVQACNARQSEQDVFIGTIAHEMRNPLAPLKTGLELLKRAPKQHGRFEHPIKIMDRQVGFLERLVEDLVDLTRVQAGKMSIAYEQVDLRSFVQEALDNCRGQASEKGLALYSIAPSVPITVEVDARRLQQVMSNLLNNAIKYTPAGGTIWLKATTDQTHFLCYVKDNGQGISAELLPHIFNVFTQAEDAHAGRGDGLGIGLAVVREIVNLHQGTVEVRSEGPGKGSEFSIRIPLHRPAGAEPEPLNPGSGA